MKQGNLSTGLRRGRARGPSQSLVLLSGTKRLRLSGLRLAVLDSKIVLSSSDLPFTRVGDHALGQLCAILNLPASYLLSLPLTLTVQNLNHALRRVEEEGRKFEHVQVGMMNGDRLIMGIELE